MADQSSVMYAGATRRFFALLLDYLLLGLITVVLKLALNDVVMEQTISLLMMMLYFIVMESSGRMASLGKSALKIYVAMDEGKKASIATIALRYVIFMLPSIPMIFAHYSSDYINMLKTLQQYYEAHDFQGLLSYAQSQEAQEISSHYKKFSIFAAFAGIIFYWLPIVFTKQKTGLHDYLTKTRVFKRTA